MTQFDTVKPIKRAASFYAASLALALAFNPASGAPVKKAQPKVTEPPYSAVLDDAKKGSISSVTISGREITGIYTAGGAFRTYLPDGDSQAVGELRASGVTVWTKPPAEANLLLSTLIGWAPTLLIVGLGVYILRRMQAGRGAAAGFGKSKAKLLTQLEGKVTFADVAGVDEAKDDLVEIVDFLKDPKKYQRLGAKIPKGALLSGKPGTGKTLLARAVAGEAGVPFFTTAGSEFVEMFAGVGASRIRDMFAQAKKSAPCIIFIDEIDAIGKTRGGGMGGVNDEREQALNQLLVEMDGIEASQGVIILAATNRPETLDPALKRPGRLDRLVTVPQPDVLGRQHILTVHARTVPLAHDVDLKAVARGTPGFAGADLANLVNEAALLAARRNKRFVGMSEFEDAREKLIMGASNTSRVISEEMRRLIAYHEAGHALLVLHQPHSEPIHKVTIIGRAGAGGYMARLPNEDTPTTRDKLRADLIVTTGGRIAEELALDGISIGAVGDIAQVTDLARAMVTQYGFSDKVGFVRHSGGQQNFLGQSVGRAAEISPDTQKLIDEEIKALIDAAYASGREILTRHRDQLDRIAAALLEHETLTGDETALAASQGSAAVTAKRNAKQTTLLNPAVYAGAMSEAIDPVPA